MIILKYEKKAQAALASHIDSLRAVTYVLRRANIEGEYSSGYNPHMNLCFSPALALGVESLAEYVSLKAEYSENMLERLNAVSPFGMRFEKIFYADVPVNPASVINRAEYAISCLGIGDAISEIVLPDYTISYEGKDGKVTKNVSSKIFSAEKIGKDTAKVALACGNENLRPDRLVKYLKDKHGLQSDYAVVKTNSFVNDVPADDFFQGLTKK